MKRDTYYFSHDYEPTADPKIQALIGEFGGEGYGIYWRIVEMLHSDKSHKLPLKKYVFLAIAKQMLTNAEQIEAILNYCIDPCELLKSDGEFLWSERVLRNISERAKLSEIRAIAGRAGAIAKQNSAKPGKGKERKGKEIVEEGETRSEKKFNPPKLEEVKAYFRENGYREDTAERAFKGYDVAGWIDSKGKKILNWKQKMIQVWFKDENKVTPNLKDHFTAPTLRKPITNDTI